MTDSKTARRKLRQLSLCPRIDPETGQLIGEKGTPAASMLDTVELDLSQCRPDHEKEEKRRRDFREKNREKKEERGPEWEEWRRAAKPLTDANPRLSKIEQARKIKKKLKLKESVNTIRQRL